MSKLVNNKIQANSLADNKTQAKKPEVFDLWEDKDGRVYLVVKTTHKYIHLMTKTLTGRKLTFKQYVRHHITNYWKYIGKSKVSIKELFDVE